MPKQEFHITDFSGGLNCYSDARDIKDYAERMIRIEELMQLERTEIMRFNKLYDEIYK